MSVQPIVRDASALRGGPEARQVAVWLALGTASYFLLGLLGRSTIRDGEVLSLVWPAAGASMLMFALTPPRWWGIVAVLVAGSTLALNVLTGATVSEAAVFVVANVLQALTAVLILRGLSPHLIGAGGENQLEQLRDFWSVLAACFIAAAVGATVGGLSRGLLLDGWTPLDGFVWWARNVAGSVAVATTGLLVLGAWQRHRTAGTRLDLRTVTRDTLRARGLEAALLVGLTVALYLLAFVWSDLLPAAFPLLVPTVWAGLRFSPLAVVVHSLAVSATVVVFTLLHQGPFADAGSWRREVLISQLFIGLVFTLGTLLALGRSERLNLTRTLSTAQGSAEGQAQLMSTIIDSMHDGVTLVDERGQVIKRNPAGAEMVRTSPDALNNVRDSGFSMTTTDGRRIANSELPWVRAIAGENVVDQDMVLVFDDGSPSRTLAVSARRLPSQDAQGVGQAVVIYHDVTADRAQRSALESFARVVAHDLLGPLGVVDGWTEMLAHDLEDSQKLTTDEAAPKLDRIRTAVETMRQLIGDLLESSTSRDQQLRSTVVDLEAMARSIAHQHSGVTSGRPPHIEITALPKAYADGAMVRQLLDNLVGNAVKYVVPGEVPRVTITGRHVGEQVEVTVADEGIGIPAAQRDQIFEAFHRADTAQGYAGHGIGLAVCKRIVERHGGRIYARPPLGERGTRIVFTLPAAETGQP